MDIGECKISFTNDKGEVVELGQGVASFDMDGKKYEGDNTSGYAPIEPVSVTGTFTMLDDKQMNRFMRGVHFNSWIDTFPLIKKLRNKFKKA